MSSRIWFALGGVTAGILAGPPLAKVLVAGVPVLLYGLFVRRRPGIAALSTIGLALVAGSLAAAIDAGDGAALRRAVTATTRCECRGRVLEQAGGLGTLVGIEPAGCAAGASGVAVTDRLDLASGTSLTLVGWLRPLDDDGFGRARARLGADVELVVLEVTPGPIRGRFHSSAATFRAALQRSTEHLSPDRSGLILGMTIGDTSALPQQILEELRRAGLTHLLAVSGSNVAIVLAMVTFGLRRLSLPARVAASLPALAFYVLIVGPEPSVLRAGTMGAIALVALLRGERADTLSLLALALTVMLLARPGLLYSVGLHLSAAATAGIVIWARPLADKLSFAPGWLALALGATLAAQVAVSPILILTFGEVSLVSPIANVLAFPAVAPITIVGLAAGVVSLLHPGGGAALMSGVSPVAGWVASVGRWSGGQAWATASVPRWTGLPLGVVVALLALSTLRRGEPAPVDDAPPREDAGMDEWRWRLHDPEGADLRTTDAFASKEEAEAWMGTEWQSLLDEGAETVSLVRGEVTIYVMGLKEE